MTFILEIYWTNSLKFPISNGKRSSKENVTNNEHTLARIIFIFECQNCMSPNRNFDAYVNQRTTVWPAVFSTQHSSQSILQSIAEPQAHKWLAAHSNNLEPLQSDH